NVTKFLGSLGGETGIESSHFSNKDFEKINNLLEELKEESKDSDTKTFYINHLIDVSNNSYLASLSKPLTFDEAKNILL
ncbi:MAG: hypothetical protein ACFNJP_05230, partial [Capnocytophaga gingivalis]